MDMIIHSGLNIFLKFAVNKASQVTGLRPETMQGNTI